MARKKATPKKAPERARWIEYLPLAEIASATRNPKGHSADLGSSIERFGYADAVILDERTTRLVAGHGRTERLRLMAESGEQPPEGIEQDAGGRWLVPVQRGWSSRSDREADAFLLAHNRLTEAGGWETEGLAAMLQELAEDSTEALDGLGWTTDEVNDLLQEAEDAAMEGFQRPNLPEFTPVTEGAANEFVGGKAKEDKLWFYVEYYGQPDRFERIKERLSMKTSHEIDKDSFEQLVLRTVTPADA